MSQKQVPADFSSKPIVTDLAHLACTWKAVPIATALMEIGVPKLVPADGSGVDVATLAQQSKVDTDLLYRYMRFVSSLGIFQELPDRHFAHNESSKLLLPGTVTYNQLLFGGSAQCGNLAATAEYVTQLRDPSKSALEHALNKSFWEQIAQTPELEKQFANFMAVVSNRLIPVILQNIQLPEVGIVADVGGGYGHVLLEFLKTNSKLTGILYELPSVAKLAEEGLKSPDSPDDSIYAKFSPEVKQRVSVVAGSYADATQLKRIADADVFFFKHIFHDNNDATCRKILAAMYQIMKSTATIIIYDIVLMLTLNEWKYALTLDLTMAEMINGKERTRNEWVELLNKGDGYEYTVSFGATAFDRALITLTKVQ